MIHKLAITKNSRILVKDLTNGRIREGIVKDAFEGGVKVEFVKFKFLFIRSSYTRWYSFYDKNYKLTPMKMEKNILD